MATAVGGSSSPVPAASTCADMIRYVVDYVQGGDDDELRDIALRAINRAKDRINASIWNKLTNTQTITFGASTQTYALEADFKEPVALALLNGSGFMAARLPFVDIDSLEWENQSPDAAGRPRAYTIDYATRELRLERPPDSTWVSTYPTARLRYHRRLAHCSGGADQDGIPADFDRFIGWDARADVAAVRGERSLAQEARSIAETAWRELRSDDFNTQQDHD